MMACEHLNLRAEEWDFGVSAETGYHDFGVRYVCECGEVLDEGEVERMERAKAKVPA